MWGCVETAQAQTPVHLSCFGPRFPHVKYKSWTVGSPPLQLYRISTSLFPQS